MAERAAQPREPPKRAYADVLRQAAESTNGALTSTTYTTARGMNPSWPNCDTIARAFGSWAAALEAAGLGDRRSGRSRSAAERVPRDFTDAELAERAAARQRVLSVVGELTTPIAGRRPTVHQYLAHRAATDLTLPSLNRLYNLFPDGWHSVLKQAAMPSLRSR